MYDAPRQWGFDGIDDEATGFVKLRGRRRGVLVSTWWMGSRSHVSGRRGGKEQAQRCFTDR